MGLRFHGNVPIFFGNKGFNILLTHDHHACGNALHAPRGKALFHLGPQQRADFIAHQAVQHTACLLRIHPAHINGTGILNGVLDGALGNLMELNAARLLQIHAQHLAQVPGDGFPLAVRVGCQINFRSGARFLADAGQNVSAAANGNVFQCKVMIHVHPDLGLGQVAHMSLGGFHLVALAQILGNGARLGGRLHDNQFLLASSHAAFLRFSNSAFIPYDRSFRSLGAPDPEAPAG